MRSQAERVKRAMSGLFDTREEKITLAIPDLKPGVHLLMVRATDSAGNVGTGDALIDVKN